MACSASFFSRNSVFLSQQFGRNSFFQSVSAKFQTSEQGHCLNDAALFVWACLVAMAESTVGWFGVREKYCSLADKSWLISQIRPSEQADRNCQQIMK